MRPYPLLLALSALCAGLSPIVTTDADAQTVGRWEKLGSREVGLCMDRDSIHVGVLSGTYRKIKLNVRDNAIRVVRVVVIYGNGAPDDIPLSAYLTPGSDSRVIDLRGGKRVIRRIDLVLKSVHNGRGKARVDVWGRH